MSQMMMCASMGKINTNLNISMGKVTFKLLISPKISIVQVQTGRTLFFGWRLPRKLDIVNNVIVNNLPQAKNCHKRKMFMSLIATRFARGFRHHFWRGGMGVP